MKVSYIYDQTIHVMVDTGNLRNTPMNERRYVAYIGVDNTIELQFKNSDRKPVNIALKTPLWQMTDPATGDVILRRYASVKNPADGLATLSISDHDLVGVEPGIYHLGISLESYDGTTEASYTDTNFDARAEIEIRTGAYAAFRISDETVSFSEPFTLLPGQPRSIYPGSSGSLKASGYLSDVSTLTTVAMYMTNFSGNIHVQECLEINPVNWFNATISANGGWDYNSYTGIDTFNVDTRARWVRICYTPTVTNVGTIDKVSARA
jgi:hypothetical protein